MPNVGHLAQSSAPNLQRLQRSKPRINKTLRLALKSCFSQRTSTSQNEARGKPILNFVASDHQRGALTKCRSSSNGNFSWLKGEGVPARALPGSGGGGNGVFLLMLLCCGVFVADQLLHLPGSAMLYLNHAKPQWWQFVTHLFCHGNWAHLSGNMFNLCVFGKMVEETEGTGGLLASFLICGLGAAAATMLLTPATVSGRATVSVGASGAIFGLFAVSVVARLRWSLKQLLEAAVLGQFVVRQVLEEAKHQVTGGLMLGGLAVSHVAHLAGAAVGVLLVLLLQRLPDPDARSGAGSRK